MKAEYKRDMNHNYLILYGESEINTDSYQVRMLVGNVIPSLLECRIQGMDGQFLVYFDITSRQSLSTLYEDRKFGVDDLRLIFGGFVQAMEDAAEYLMNPGQMVIAQEYIFADMEKKKIYFCLMPGYEKDIREQFQTLTEYILPKIDHEDGDAVILGYGVYRRGMEDSFHLEHIKEELYKTQGKGGRNTGRKRENISDNITGNMREKITGSIAGDIVRGLTGDRTEERENESSREDVFQEFDRPFRRNGETDCRNVSGQGGHVFNGGKGGSEITEERKYSQNYSRNFMRENTDRKEKVQKFSAKRLWILLLTFFLVCGIVAATFFGYLPYTESGVLLGGVLVAMGSIMLLSFFYKKRKKKSSGQSFQEERSRWNQNDRSDSDFHVTETRIKDWEINDNRNDNGESHESQELFFKDSDREFQEENRDKTGNKKKTADKNTKKQYQGKQETFGETVVLSAGMVSGPASLVSKEPGELATIYLNDDLTVIGKLENACDAVINLPTVSRIHAKIRKKEEGYYLTDMNSRNGTAVNGKLLLPDEEYQLQQEDEVDFAQARYVFLE